jgi:hypothetical protein
MTRSVRRRLTGALPSTTRLNQPHERANDAMKEGAELRVERPDEADGFGSFEARERFPG